MPKYKKALWMCVGRDSRCFVTAGISKKNFKMSAFVYTGVSCRAEGLADESGNILGVLQRTTFQWCWANLWSAQSNGYLEMSSLWEFNSSKNVELKNIPTSGIPSPVEQLSGAETRSLVLNSKSSQMRICSFKQIYKYSFTSGLRKEGNLCWMMSKC